MKIYCALIIALFLALFSCKDDDEMVSPLVGTWTLIKQVHSNCDRQGSNKTTTYTCAVDYCIQWTFTKDNKGTFDDGAGSILNGTYSISGDQIAITVPGEDSLVFTFNVIGNMLTLTHDIGSCDEAFTFTKS